MPQFDPAYLYHIASLYYQDMLSQQEIAERERLSRPQVSRMLAQARKSGIVKIDLVMPSAFDSASLADAVKVRLGLAEVHVVPCPNRDLRQAMDEDQRIIDFSLRAAPLIARLIDPYEYVGLGWGRTIYHIATNLPDSVPSQPHVLIPLAGSNSGIVGREYQISTVSFLFGEKLHSRSFFLNISKLSENENERSAYEKSCYEQLERYWDMMDAAVFGVGPADYASLETQHQRSATESVVGDILLQTYFADGSSVRAASSEDMIAIDIQRLKRIPHTILSAIGAKKVKAIVYAAKLGFFNTLVTDEDTAQEILDSPFITQAL